MGRQNKQSTTKMKRRSPDRKSSGRKPRNVIEYTNEPDDDSNYNLQSESSLYSNKNDGRTTTS